MYKVRHGMVPSNFSYSFSVKLSNSHLRHKDFHTPRFNTVHLGKRQCYVMLCYVMSRVKSCHVMSRHVVLCSVLSCHVMSCQVMSCHVMSCYVMLCYVIDSRLTTQFDPKNLLFKFFSFIVVFPHQ